MPPLEAFYPTSQINPLDKPGRHPRKPWIDDTDEYQYTLSGYGDISLSNTLFIPGLPSPIAPRNKRWRSTTPPPRTRVGDSVVASASPDNSSPAGEFAALPNYEAIVARLRRLRERATGKEEEVVVDDDNDDDKDDSSSWLATRKETLRAKNLTRQTGKKPIPLVVAFSSHDQQPSSLSMSLLQAPNDTDVPPDADWQNDGGEPRTWWRTAPLTVNSWAYTPDNEPGNRIPPHSYLVSHPSTIHLTSPTVADSDDLCLGPALVGVKVKTPSQAKKQPRAPSFPSPGQQPSSDSMSPNNSDVPPAPAQDNGGEPLTWSRTVPYTPPDIRIPPHSYLVSHPSAMHLASFRAGPPVADSDDLRLDPALVGVKAVEDTIAGYETATGFRYTVFPEFDDGDFGLPPPLNLAASEEDVMESNKAWTESLKDFITTIQELSLEGSMSNSFIESEPSSGSDNSTEFFAMPLTPVLKGGHLSDVIIKSPNSTFGSPGIEDVAFTPKTLNRFASSFIPTLSSPPAHTGTFSFTSISDSLREKKKKPRRESLSKDGALPSLSSFTFPTLNPPTKSTARLTTVKIKKDEQGFFTDVQVDNTTKSAEHAAVVESLLLPPFLQEPTPRRRPRVSRTREIVDRLRSSQSEATPPPLSAASILNFNLDLDDTNNNVVEPNGCTNGTANVTAGGSSGKLKLKPSLDFSFDLQPKSASLCPSPKEESACLRPRSSVSDDGANRGRESMFSTPSQDDELEREEGHGDEDEADGDDVGDDDGWIDLARPATTKPSANSTKVKRARDLFLALTRRRTDSISSEPTQEVTSQPSSSSSSDKGATTLADETHQTHQQPQQSLEDSQQQEVKAQSASAPSPSKQTRYAANRDGWIDGVVSAPASTVVMDNIKLPASSPASTSVSASVSSASSPCPSSSQMSKVTTPPVPHTTNTHSSSKQTSSSTASHRKKGSSRSGASGGSGGGSMASYTGTSASRASFTNPTPYLSVVPPPPHMNPVGIMSAPLHAPPPFFYPGTPAIPGYHAYPHHIHGHLHHQPHHHHQYHVVHQATTMGMGIGMPVAFAPVGFGFGTPAAAAAFMASASTPVGHPAVGGGPGNGNVVATGNAAGSGQHRKGGSVSTW